MLAGIALVLVLVVIFLAWCFGLTEAIKEGYGWVIVVGIPLAIMVDRGWESRDFGVFLWTLAAAIAVNLLLYLVTGRGKTKTPWEAVITLGRWLPRQVFFSPVLAVFTLLAIWIGSEMFSFTVRWFRLG